MEGITKTVASLSNLTSQLPPLPTVSEVLTFSQSLFWALVYLFAPSRGLFFSAFLGFIVFFPWELLRTLNPLDKTVKLDIFSRVVARTLRYMLGDNWVAKNNFLMNFIDYGSYVLVKLQGFNLQYVHERNIKGMWMSLRGKSIPNKGSSRWNDTLVVFWIHGKYFSPGTPMVGRSAKTIIAFLE